MRAGMLTMLLIVACSAEPTALSFFRRDARPLPSFRKDIAPVLEQHCTTRGGCHGDEPEESVSLDLQRDAALRSLVNVPSELGRQLRVAPGDPHGSLLVRKLVGPLDPDEGAIMPLDDTSRITARPTPLPPHFVDDVLVPWIAAGAPDS